ncbi:zinc-ribbon domain-containing protein [Bacillus rhizoplanae]|uniref:zinc-ribbon domain-containing protein n=1 Tax=Bacillus rhizoplanae TaxID=2880966 RepID=UPI003D1FEEF4
MSNSNRKYWWICDKGHEWKAVVSNRTLFNKGCPYCSGHKAIQGETDLGTKFPEISKWWNHERNHPLLPSQFKPQSNKKVWWQCDEGHEWEAVICSRFKNKGCPICSGRKVLKGFNDLSTLNPKLAKEWHPNKNGELQPTQFTLGSDKKIWWQCDKGHEWEAKVDQRSRLKSGCPYCSGNRAIIGETDLATLMPELSTQWHPTKNLNLSPSQIKKSSNKKVWWLCDKGHEWEAVISARSNGTGCPYCSGQRVAVGENDLATLNPYLAKEWHPYKNGDLLPIHFTKSSGKKIWWLCEIGHEWESTIANRNNGNGCPHCRKAKLNK